MSGACTFNTQIEGLKLINPGDIMISPAGIISEVISVDESTSLTFMDRHKGRTDPSLLKF